MVPLETSDQCCKDLEVIIDGLTGGRPRAIKNLLEDVNTCLAVSSIGGILNGLLEVHNIGEASEGTALTDN
jgi:hypothetical protein